MHYRDGAAGRIEVLQHIVPNGTGLDMQDLSVIFQSHGTERSHIDDNSVRSDDVASHAVPRTGDRDFQAVASSSPEQLCQFGFGGC